MLETLRFSVLIPCRCKTVFAAGVSTPKEFVDIVMGRDVSRIVNIRDAMQAPRADGLKPIFICMPRHGWLAEVDSANKLTEPS